MKSMKQIWIITLVILIMGITSSFATTGKSNTNGLRLRKEPSTSGEVLTSINNGEEVTIIEKSGDWYKVKYKGTEGYVHSSYITTTGEVPNTTPSATPSPSAPPSTPTPDANEPDDNNVVDDEPTAMYPRSISLISNTSLYIIPSVTSSVITEIREGQTITIYERLNNWSYISYDNKTGWVRNYILENVVTNPEPDDDTTVTSDTPATTENRKGYVNVSEAIMRDKPSTSGSVIRSLSLNAEVTILREDGDFYKIEYNGTTGYMAQRLISDRQSTTSRGNESRQIKAGYVNVGVANVRVSASTSASILTTLKQKTKVDIIGEELDFYIIDVIGEAGYIAKRLVSDSLESIEAQSAPTFSSVGTASGEAVVAYAREYLGYKYVSGGTTPSGFDCSGFVYYIFNNAGYAISRSCSAQASSGTAVSKANLQLGDLVFFNNNSDGSIGHVGIYIGGGNFIHSANARRGVVIDTINSGYYHTYYYSARRMIE